MNKTANCAIELMKQNNAKLIWYGQCDLIHEIADAAGYKPQHPINRMSAVIRNISKSNLFERCGAIEHLGHRHPVFRIKK